MQFPTTTFLVFALTGFTTTINAAPSMDPVDVFIRDNPIPDPAKVLDRMVQSPRGYTWKENLCAHDVGSPAPKWVVAVTNGKKYDKECGRGFLDNFRGRCGVITTWNCDYFSQSPDTAVMSFFTSAFCTEFDITSAIKAAGNGLHIDCHPDVHSVGGGIYAPPVKRGEIEGEIEE